MVKNKVAPPFREAQFDILYNEGISRLGDLVDTAVEQNIIAKSGSWFSYGEERIGQGRDAVKKYLQENETIAKKIDGELRRKLGLASGPRTARPGNGESDAAKRESPAAKAPPPAPPPPRPEPARKK